MRIPDWLVYAIALVVVVGAVFQHVSGRTDRWTPPVEIVEIEPPEGEPDLPPGPPLASPGPLDEQVLVQVGEVSDGIGTAFAVNPSGVWLTARHVVDGCSDVGIVVGGGRLASVNRVVTSRTSDLALLYTNRAPQSLALDLERPLQVGEAGYHFGFPQGREGEASSRLLSRSRLITRGRYELDEPVLAWAEIARSDKGSTTLAGMSGGPVLDAQGAVIGVTVAESPRRGRIYTAAPESVADFISRAGATVSLGEARPIASTSYEREADRLRDEFAVVQVVCHAGR
ncbi:serine protease [bacterium]|nr:serine protease [bacterium]